MEYVNLGRTGLQVSRLCLGCMTYGEPERGSHPWTLPEAASRPFLKAALDAGINFFDTSNSYSAGSSEEILGRAVLEYTNREDVVIATKVFFPPKAGPNQGGLSRKAIFREVDRSLARLGTDYIDLYQIHRWDNRTPIEETLEALHDVVRAGKVRYLGASTMYAWQFAKALYLAQQNGWTRFVSMQNQYNLLYREEEREMLRLCAAEGIGVIPWSPLARGQLTRPWSATSHRQELDPQIRSLNLGYTDTDRAIIDAVGRVAEARGATRAQVALAWVLRNPVITAPIVGASKLQHLHDALAALKLTLTDDEVATLEAPYRPRPLTGVQ